MPSPLRISFAPPELRQQTSLAFAFLSVIPAGNLLLSPAGRDATSPALYSSLSRGQNESYAATQSDFCSLSSLFFCRFLRRLAALKPPLPTQEFGQQEDIRVLRVERAGAAVPAVA